MERVVRPGVFVLAALVWGLLFVGEALLCSSDITDSTNEQTEATTTSEDTAVE